MYLDWNATAPLRPEARAAMLEAMDVVGNPSSVHAEGRAAKAIIEKARGQVAALVGCILGAIAGTAIPILVIGNLIGACLGAFLGAGLYEYIKMEKKAGEAAWTGFGAALGKVGGLFAKLFCGFAMLVVIFFSF